MSSKKKTAKRSSGSSGQVGVLLLASCALLLLAGLGSLLNAGDKTVTESVWPTFSEVMPDNEGAYPAPDGGYYSWVELWNGSSEAIDLSKWSIGGSIDPRGAAALPKEQLLPGERKVFFLADSVSANDQILNAKLERNDGTLCLFDGKGRPVVVCSLPPTGRNTSLIQDPETLTLSETKLYSPGEENTEAGHQAAVDQLRTEETVVINEVMASNGTTLAVDGTAPDWIEITAVGDSVDISGWSLTTDLTNRVRWRFPEGTTVSAGQYLLVYASNDKISEGLNTGFSIPKKDGHVYLIDRLGRTVSSMAWERLERDESCSRIDGGKTTTDMKPSPGAANGGRSATQTVNSGSGDAIALSRNDQGIYINEVVCSSTTEHDWVEIYNSTGAAFDLSGWWLSDKNDRPREWSFPNGTSVPAGGYLTVWLNGSDAAESYQTGAPIASFSLSLADTLTGESCVTLAQPDGTVTDRVKLSSQRKDVSYGRSEGRGTYRYFTEPTRGAANSGTSYAGLCGDVGFSVEGGAHAESSITIELTCGNGASIYYTTNGSKPTASSAVYSGPITISENTVIRATAAENDMLPSAISTRTYILGRGSNGLRIVCVNDEDGSVNTMLGNSKKTEHEVNVEVYDYDGSLMIDQGAIFRLSGANTRMGYPQKAFKLFARKSVGAGKFKAQLFRNRDYTEYNSFLMRSSGQDMFQTHMRDSILTSLAADTQVLYQETELSALFVNGKYWGMYNMRENLNEDSVCQFEGWDESDSDTIDYLCGSGMSAVQGSSSTYKAVLKFVKEHDMSDDANVEQLRTIIDIENYIDFVCLMVYTDHEDLGNVAMYRNSNGDGLWRWAIYDLDFASLNDKNSMRMWMSSSGEIGSITTHNNTLFYQLMKNAKFRDQFLTRMGELLATTFSSTNVQGKIMGRYEAIQEEIKLNCQRWDVKYETFQSYVKRFYEYAGSRTYKLIGYISDILELTAEEQERYFGAAIANEKAALANAADS